MLFRMYIPVSHISYQDRLQIHHEPDHDKDASIANKKILAGRKKMLNFTTNTRAHVGGLDDFMIIAFSKWNTAHSTFVRLQTSAHSLTFLFYILVWVVNSQGKDQIDKVSTKQKQLLPETNMHLFPLQ